MANEIRDAFNTVYADGPSGSPSQPEKSQIRSQVGGTIQTVVDGLGTRLTAVEGIAGGLPSAVADLGERVDDVEAALDAGIKPAKKSVRLLVETATDPATMTAGSTLDGLVLAAGNRVARAATPADALNGVYVVQAAGAALRSADMDAEGELVGARFDVDAGSHASEVWSVQTLTPIVVGTTVITIEKTTSANLTTAEVQTARTGEASLADVIASVGKAGPGGREALAHGSIDLTNAVTGVGPVIGADFSITIPATTGTYTRDLQLSAAEIAAGAVFVLVPIVSGSPTTLTSQQFAVSVAIGTAAALLKRGNTGRRWYFAKITLDPTATKIRISATNTSGTPLVIREPRIGVGEPAEALTDARLAALDQLLLDQVNAAENIGGIATIVHSAGSGTAVLLSSTSAMVPAGNTDFLYVDADQLKPSDSYTLLFRVSRPVNGILVRPTTASGASAGTSATVRKLKDGWYIAQGATAALSTGGKAAYIQLRVTNTTVGTYLIQGDVTVDMLRLFRGTVSPPGMLTVPGAVAAVTDVIAARTTALESSVAVLDDWADPFFVLGTIDDRITYLNAIAKYVDGGNGSDGNAGTASAPYATWLMAYNNTSAGQVIGLRNGFSYDPAGTTGDRGVIGHGNALRRARFDTRIKLAGATWTVHDDPVWKTTVTFSEATEPGLAAPTFNPMLWNVDNGAADDIGTPMIPRYTDQATIAANVALVKADPNSFTIHKNGSTVANPNADTAGTQYDVYVHVPRGVDPNGMDLRVSNRNIMFTSGAGDMHSIETIGAHGKDHEHTGTTVAVAKTRFDMKVIHSGAHGSVGPFNSRGPYIVIGRGLGTPTEENTNHGRGKGYCINHYVTTDGSTRDLSHENLILSNGAYGLGGHGQTNIGYRNIAVRRITVDNCASGVQFEARPGVDKKFVVGLLTIDRATFTRVDQAFKPSGNMLVKGGSVVFAGNAEGYSLNDRVLTTFIDNTEVHEIRDLDLRFTTKTWNGFTRKQLLATVATTSEGTDTGQTLILDGVQDLSEIPEQMGALDETASKQQFHLHLRATSRPCILGDLLKTVSSTAFPLSLTVEAGCTFGLGGRTGPEIEADLTTALVTHSISHDTTIVDALGNVLSAPGW